VPTLIPALKARVSGFSLSACRELATRALALDSAAAVRELVARIMP
jgi:phosphoenolpyruvate-protein kinase (PTS system EI component)